MDDGKNFTNNTTTEVAVVEATVVNEENVQGEQPSEQILEQNSDDNGKRKKKINWKNALILGCIVIVIVVAFVLTLIFATNNFKTPAKIDAKITTEIDDYDDVIRLRSNGLFTRDIKKMMKIMDKSIDFESLFENYENILETDQNYFEQMHGEDYKIVVKMQDKEKLDADSVEKYKEEMRNSGVKLETKLEPMKDYSNKEWKSFAENLGLSKAQAKRLVKMLRSFARKLQDVSVTKAYELDYQFIERNSKTVYGDYDGIIVVKANGRWVMASEYEGFVTLIIGVLDSNMFT